jgi:hypothetical protein
MSSSIKGISVAIPPRLKRIMRDVVVYAAQALILGWMVWSVPVPDGWPVWSWGRPVVFVVMLTNLILIDLHIRYGVGEKFVGKWKPCQKLSLLERRRR